MSRVSEIRYVGYGVGDVAAERRFYEETWGLVPVASNDGLTWLKTQGHDEHHVVRLREASANGIDVIALATPSRADVDALFAKVQASGAHEPGRRLRLPLLLARRPAVRDLE